MVLLALYMMCYIVTVMLKRFLLTLGVRSLTCLCCVLQVTPIS